MSYPTVSDDTDIQNHYEECRKNGASHALSEMFALACPPMSNTDREFLMGTENGRQFQGQDRVGDHYRQIAEAEGVNTKGKVYKSGLAAYPGDGRAWVSGRGDVQRVCEERGWGCDGAVNVKPRESLEPPKPGPDIADDLLDKYTAQVASQYPDPHLIDAGDLREQVRERIKPKRKREVSRAQQ